MMWAKSSYRHGNTRRVWHRVTIAAWDPGKLQTVCGGHGHILQRHSSEQRTDPPLIDVCLKCARVTHA